MKIKILTDDGNVIFEKGIVKDEDIQSFDEVVNEVVKFMHPFVDATNTFIKRQDEYGNTWEIPEFQRHECMLTAMVCLVKCKRIAQMLDKEDNQKFHAQLLKTTIDLINYANFLHQLLEKRSKQNK